MIPDSIKRQIRDGKSVSVDFIADAGDVERSARTVCAFLNGKGGAVFCGVDDEGHLVGTVDAESAAVQLRQYLQESITPHAPLLSVTVDEEGPTRIVSIEVPAGTQPPYVYQGAAYVRRGRETRVAEAETLHRLLQSASITIELWERRVSTALEESDLDADEITDTATEASRSGRYVFAEGGRPMAVLRQLGLVVAEQFTNAADVLFAKNPAMRHPQVRLRATCFAEDKESATFIDDKVFEGPLVNMLAQAEIFIRRNTRTTVSFRNQGLQTADNAEYPTDAVREGLVNAFAHRDYAAFHGGVAVRVFPSRLEIWNSGHLPAPLKPGDLKKNHPSIPVNPTIVQVLYIRGYMNRIGRGTQKIVNLCREYGLRPPTWRDSSAGVTLTLHGRAGGEARQTVFSSRQLALLDSLGEGDEIRPGDYRRRFADGVTERQARRDLTDLEAANLLERMGAGAATRYRRTKRGWKGLNRT